MTILKLDRKELEKNIGKITPKIEENLNMFGMPIEELTTDTISFDITANRPDLLSFHGYLRAILSFLELDNKIKEYKIEDALKDYIVEIEPSLRKVRPYTVCAIVKNLKFDDSKIKEIIDIQEKLHAGYGRNRKKLAIGIYPLEEIKLPIKFLALKPEDIKFKPLESAKEMNGRQILSSHPAGREYGNLLKDLETFPVFIDANNEILSMPPIINSHKTGKITEKTKEIFIECSGFDKIYLEKALKIILTDLIDLGGVAYSMKINKEKEIYSINLNPNKIQISIKNINKILGLDLGLKEIKKCLNKMGHDLIIEDNKYYALVPPYRIDILHEVDIIEDIAISYGYDNFIPIIPAISTIAKEDSSSITNRNIAKVLSDLGLLETSTYHLSTKEKQFKNIGIKDFREDMIELVDSKTENNILRNSLLSQSIMVLGANTDASYPQKIFEIGTVFSHDKSSSCGIKEEEHLCVALCSEKSNFTTIKQVLDYLSRMLDIKYSLKESEHPCYINGRCGEIIVNEKTIGYIGEIAPFILKNNKIKMPVAAFELDIKNMMSLNPLKRT